MHGPAWVDTFLLRNGEVGCLKAVKLTLSVKVRNLTNGATAARRVFRRPLQPLKCSGQPAQNRSIAAFNMAPLHSRRSIEPEVEEECIEVATALPTGHETMLRFRSGVPRGDYKREHWVLRFFLPAMPKECKGAVGRYLLVSIQIQDPKNPNRWQSMEARKWQIWDNQPEARWVGGGWSATGETDRGLKGAYACSPGSRITEVRVLLKARAFVKESGQPTLAQHRYELPVKVTGAC